MTHVHVLVFPTCVPHDLAEGQVNGLFNDSLVLADKVSTMSAHASSTN